MCRGGVAAPARYETSCRTRRAAQRRPCFCPPYNYAFLHSPCAGCFQTQLFSPAGKILIYRGVGTYRPHPSRLRRATFPKGEGFWMRFTWPTCRGCRGRQRPDFQSYAATCAPRAGAFLRQGACDQSKKAFLADFKVGNPEGFQVFREAENRCFTNRRFGKQSRRPDVLCRFVPC